MIKIGGGWCKTSKNNNEYISASIAKELLPLTITEGQFISLHLNTAKEKAEQPDYNLCLSLADEKD